MDKIWRSAREDSIAIGVISPRILVEIGHLIQAFNTANNLFHCSTFPFLAQCFCEISASLLNNSPTLTPTKTVRKDLNSPTPAHPACQPYSAPQGTPPSLSYYSPQTPHSSPSICLLSPSLFPLLVRIMLQIISILFSRRILLQLPTFPIS